jgi:hypothetical protein
VAGGDDTTRPCLRDRAGFKWWHEVGHFYLGLVTPPTFYSYMQTAIF